MKGSSLASLGRAQSMASVGVSSKLTPAKEGSWSLKALGGPSTKGSGFQKRKGAGRVWRLVSCWSLSWRLVFMLLPSSPAWHSASRPCPNPFQPLHHNMESPLSAFILEAPRCTPSRNSSEGAPSPGNPNLSLPGSLRWIRVAPVHRDAPP